MEVYKDTLECRLGEELNHKEKIKNEMKLPRLKTVQSEKQTRACDEIIKQGKEENTELWGFLTGLETKYIVLKKALVEKEKDNQNLRKEKKNSRG